MTRPQRITLTIALLVIAGLLIAFTTLKWDQANRLATVASLVVAVLSLGAAVFFGLRPAQPPRRGGITVRNSGNARATGAGSRATSGAAGAPGAASGPVEVSDSGDAEARDGGRGTSGWESRP
ncbi:hypothetical protein [Streptomyces sp. NPDC056401]|uniref:hypothetical protein n=1 Tax=Streptomyces sp. NPDC056401 TaxID=3345809 RepID=UPI0035DA86F0